MTRSYAAYMQFRSEPDSTNALRFATAAEADAYGAELFSRWTMPTGFRVAETDDPITHAWIDGKAERITILGGDDILEVQTT